MKEKIQLKQNANKNAGSEEDSSYESKNTSHAKKTDEGHEKEPLFMDKIGKHTLHKSKNHPTAWKGQTLYLVRWYDYRSDDETLETVENLLRSQVLSYH